MSRAAPAELTSGNYMARVELDSISPDGVRVTTIVARYPRFILAEVNTHRMLSRNTASSRAIPVDRQIKAIEDTPFIPATFGANQKGMQASSEVDNPEQAECTWRGALVSAVARARQLADLGVHKQHANRLLEPFAWATTVFTATDWQNFFALRCHPAPQPEFQKIAHMMQAVMDASTPKRLEYGQWHLPFIREEDRVEEQSTERLKWISAARAARVSYLTHDGRRDHSADLELFERLVGSVPRHASPLEMVLTPDPKYPAKVALRDRLIAENGNVYERWMEPVLYNGNVRGWKQFRHEIPQESVPG